MAGGKLPPRQKMIGLMYLVLLALLAMNVSKSILDSFLVINSGIESTKTTFAEKNAFYYEAFDRAAQESPAAKAFADKAYKVKKMADDLDSHIKKLKSKIIELTDGIPAEVADTIQVKNVNAKDNYDQPTHVMGLGDPAKPVKVPGLEDFSGITLREKINAYEKGILDVFEDKAIKEDMANKVSYLATPELVNSDGGKDAWEVGVFYHIPLAATITMLSKIQADVRTAEAEVIAKLYENIDAGSVSFNKVDGFAYAKKAYVMDGDSFAAQIFTAAYDDRQNPQVFIGKIDSSAVAKGETDENKIMQGSKGEDWAAYKSGGWFELKDVEAGKGYLKIKESVGVHNWGGIIKVKTKKGPKIYPFENSFEVGKPSLAISADKMNVFYIGVDNPVSIAAPMPKFTASAPGLSQKGTGWVMRPKKPGKVNIVVTGIDDEGNKVNLGKSEFRVKRIPDPKAYCGGKTGSESIRLVALKNASTVQAKMENFDFDIRVQVSSFVFSTTKAGVVQEFKVNGNKLDSRCKGLIGKSKRNQKFFLEKIMVRMPDGTTRKLSPIILKVI